MAFGSEDHCLAQSLKLVVFGNDIAVHILAYLGRVKSPSNAFRKLAEEFLDTCRVLIAIYTGLEDSGGKIGVSNAHDLRERLHQTLAALTLLDQMVNKCNDNDRKPKFIKLGKGLRMVFSDSESESLRLALSKCHDALLMKQDVLEWTLRSVNMQAARSVGYTALAAVLGCADPAHKAGTDMPGETAMRRSSVILDAPLGQPPLLSPPRIGSRASSREVGLSPLNNSSSTLRGSNNARNLRPSNVHGESKTSAIARSLRSASSSSYREDLTADNLSEITAATSIMASPERKFAEPQAPNQTFRAPADATKGLRLTPNQNTSANSPSAKASLLVAIRRKDHEMVARLLNSGVPTDFDPDRNLLSIAVVNHDLTSARLLCQFGADTNAKDKSGFTPLLTATQASFLEAAELLLQFGALHDLSAGPHDESPFARSLISGQTQFAELYLRHGANPNALMSNGDTSFIQAITKTASVDQVGLMLTYDADPNRKNGRGETALFKAINMERLDIVTLLVENGADPNLPGPKHMFWPAVHQPKILEYLLERGGDLTRAPGILELATSINSAEAVEVLLKHGADPNSKKDGIFTPLCTAIRDDRKDLVETLIAAGADPNLAASEYPTFKCITHHRAYFLPQLLAAGADPNNPKGIVETCVAHNDRDGLLTLLEHNADPNARSSSGHTALTTAIRMERIELVDILLAHGADPGIRGQEWPISMALKSPELLAKLLPRITRSKIPKGALEQAVVANELDSVKLLLAKGVDVEEKNGGVFSPLTTAIREDRKVIFRYLLEEAGADPNAPGEHLPIVKAIRRHRENDLSYIEHLIKHNADINLMYRGWNAVLQAVDNGDTQILKLLAYRGHPDLTAQDENGRSVLEIMRERGLQEEESLLMSAMPSPELQSSLGQLQKLHDAY